MSISAFCFKSIAFPLLLYSQLSYQFQRDFYWKSSICSMKSQTKFTCKVKNSSANKQGYVKDI